MRTLSIHKIIYALLASLVGLLAFVSCQEDQFADDHHISELKLEISDFTQLKPEMYASSFHFSWSPADNKGTGSAIHYFLEIDSKENSFSNPITYELGRNIYEYDLNVNTFNNILVNTFSALPGESSSMQARVIAKFANESLATQESTVDFDITPYHPLTEELYIVGDASPKGWDISNAIALEQNPKNIAEFTYQGSLNKGEFKFAVSTDGCWCQDFYTKDANFESQIVHNIGGSGDDLKWSVSKAGNYVIKVNVVQNTISITEDTVPKISNLWLVGDAVETGWDINNPLAIKATDNPSIFEIETSLKEGNFKILAGATGDFCGDWYRPMSQDASITETKIQALNGCDNDLKWKVNSSEVGRYTITVNIANNTISIAPVEVYLIGDATTNGWNMGSLVAMEKNNGVYTYKGALKEGEMKFVKFNTSWCGGDEIVAKSANQSISNWDFESNYKCGGNDNKWLVKASEAGNYTITIDLNQSSLKIVKD